MVPEQRRAWFTLAVIAMAAAVFFALVPALGVKPAAGAFGLLGLLGLTPLLFRKQRDPSEVSLDERDVNILQTATLLGGMSSYLAFVIACMTVWSVRMIQADKTLSIHVLPVIVFCGAIVLLLVRAIATLVLYGRGETHGQD